jgi:hypothetical protein
MDLGEIVALMTVEAPAFEAKPATLVYFMTLGALNVRDRRMLMERRESGRRIRARRKANLLLTAIPQQPEGVYSGTHLDDRVKDIRKRFLSLDWLAIEFEFSSGSRRNDIRAIVRQGGPVYRPHNLPRLRFLRFKVRDRPFRGEN